MTHDPRCACIHCFRPLPEPQPTPVVDEPKVKLNPLWNDDMDIDIDGD